MTTRYQNMLDWLQAITGTNQFEIQPASSDASFRRYWRLSLSDETRIIMDAPPDKENCLPFIEIAQRLQRAGVNVPAIHQTNLEQGFLLLSDLGNTLYLNSLDEGNASHLYGQAIESLLRIQKNAEQTGLPPYDRTLLNNEMNLFRDWLIARDVGYTLSSEENEALNKAFTFLADSALEQPQVFVHRDYHSRNLMITDFANPGILDFQDAVIGPLTYDLVSLLRDCYITWPLEQVKAWALDYFYQGQKLAVIASVPESQFIRWFDLMGVQRHLKASGIFARLWHRDGKPGYLRDIPRTLAYIQAVSPNYPQLSILHRVIDQIILPFFSIRDYP